MQPCYKYINNTIDKQVLKIVSEALEMLEAMMDKNYDHTLEELKDVKQAVITAEAIFKSNGYDVEKMERQVIEKNQERGYYDGRCETDTNIRGAVVSE